MSLKNKVSVAGTFSAAAARGMGTSGAYQKEMLDVSKRIAANTDPKNQKDEKTVAEMMFPPDELPDKSKQADAELVTINKAQERLLRDIVDGIRRLKGGFAFT